MKKFFVLLFLLAQSATTACVGIGYSNRGGWFFWPGGLGLVLLILIVVLLFRRR
ncbi:MAG TPA: hypothetical protein PLD20_05995 [Blastocatellia bacterium]|nr:hypothetical protein [Blastocatellia bacterium]HMV84297.1 hypothetical protein [Blastocatellia bacterium]HMX29990.1 hypothetical protein [Blastocatellia bacterium]HMZ17459.1 hypothetical protein [Blastocatellia bacterium]HNG28757.1 hypothetical protein [Blastocatellia bacterium]